MQIQGFVVHGKGEAQTLGYPTANIEYSSAESIKSGVWTCSLIVDTHTYQGLAIIGMWSLKGGEPSLEVYLLDFGNDLYDKTVDVVLGEYLRPLTKYENNETLIQQIQADIKQARAIFTT